MSQHCQSFQFMIKTWTCTRCFMQQSYLYASDLPFNNFIYSRYLTSFESCYCKKQTDVSFLCVCPLIKDKFCHNIVRVCCKTTCLRLVVPQPLWQCYDAIYLNWRQFVKFIQKRCMLSPHFDQTGPHFQSMSCFSLVCN